MKPAIDTMTTDDKRKALAALLEANAKKESAYPLSDAQLGMWFQQTLEPDNCAYNIPLAFCLRGRLRDPLNLVGKVLADVVQRHPTLRTSFVLVDDEPQQRVADVVPIGLTLRNLDIGENEDWQAAIPLLTRQQASDAFDLRAGALFRFELLRVQEELHILLATFHHIAMDGWSIGVFLKDFAQAYIAHTRNQPLAFDPMPVSYRQYVLRQRSAGNRALMGAHLDYWQERLHDCPPSLNLPVEYRRSPGKSFSGATHGFDVPPDIVQRLNRIGQLNGATSFMTMLATFYVLLARISDQDDIVLGVSVSNRDDKDYRAIVGLFSDVLPMRGCPKLDASFSRFLQDTRTVCLADYEHANAPLSAIIERVRPVREADRNLLFQVGFDFQNTPWPAVLGNYVSLLNGDTGSSKLDLNLNLSKVQDTLSAVFEYDTHLFSAQAIARIERCYQTLLRSIVDNPHLALGQLEMLDASERASILNQWNRVDAIDGADSPDATIVALLQQCVDNDPDRIALEERAVGMTYRELDARSSDIARALSEQRVVRGERVGLFFKRGASYVTALFGVNKAGACYVPIDPDTSTTRRDHILTDAGIRVVLTTRALSVQWVECANVRLVIVEDIGATAEAAPFVNQAHADQTAYIIYTSGTTGKPKGVMVPNAAIARFARTAATTFAHGVSDRVLQFASISFDTSAEEIFPALLGGATLVFADEEMAGSAERFLAECCRRRISVLNLPTAYWHEVVDALHGSAAVLPDALRLVIIGGEAASPQSLSRWQGSVSPQVRLLNTYGPTETTVSVTTAELSTARHPERMRAVSIGCPNPGVRIYIVDKHGSPQPQGIYGEIMIGGCTLAQGYNDAPDLTAERFISDPFVNAPDARMYRTGDFGRFLEDGTIEFAGRHDNQVKILGFRVELAEVEAAILACADVSQAAAILVGEGATKRIAAFVVPDAGAGGLAPGDLRARMQREVPPHMVPSHVVVVEALPITVNGKIDRAALAARVLESIESSVTGDLPHTAEQAILASIWSNVLGVDRIGLHDNFFDLGGHSLLLMRMLSRVRRVFGVDVSLASAFAAPTIAQLSIVILELRAAGPMPEVAAIARSERRHDTGETRFRQSSAQQRLWFLDRLAPGSSAYNNPSAMRIEGALDIAALRESVDLLVARHETLRTSFADGDDGYPVQIVNVESDIGITQIDLASLDEAARQRELARLIADDARRPFDLRCGPLLRMTVLACAEREHVLLFNWHHVITDAGALTVFITELAEIYRSLVEKRSHTLSPLPLQYADFAEWESQHQGDANAPEHLDYWRGKLDGAAFALGLPYRAGALRSRIGLCRRTHRRIPAHVAGALIRIARAHDCTLYIACLAAFKLLLSRYTGEPDVVVGTPISARSRQELESIIGFFINTLAMRTDLRTAANFSQVLERVRKTAVDAYAHQQIPFERLVRELQRTKPGAASATFDVSFVLENRAEFGGVFPGATITPLPRGLQDAKFPLSLSMREVEGGIDCEWEWADDLFDRTTIEGMADRYQTLLGTLVATPEVALSQLSLLDESQSSLLNTWSDGDHEVIEAACLHEQVEHQAERRPDAIAVMCEDGQLTYAQLNARANRLAQHLRAHGVGAEALVAVCVERSLHLAVAILAVWKAGGAYVPLDPAYPAQRISDILDDTQTRWVLSQTHLRERFADIDAQVWAIDDAAFEQSLAAYPSEDIDRAELALAPTNLAYVIFTSGSTGRPKGVMVEHRSAVNLGQALRTQLESAGVKGACRWAWNASVSFDASVQALTQWACGSTLYLLPESLRRDPADLLAYLQKNRIDVLDTTPLHAELLLNALEADITLPVLVIGGEAIGPALWERIAAHYAGSERRALNVYGPTETCVDATSAWIESGHPTIGRPLANVRCHVLDRNGQVQPMGALGELHIGGAGVARGYLNRPELTAERFIEITLNGTRERVYRSGDTVRWLPDGTLEFIGRSDGQVKIRGYRVELGEIEHRLRQLAGVTAAAVTARGEEVRELVAYIVRDEHRQQDDWIEPLRQALRASLPAYMLPSHFVALDALPLTTSGKLDVAALPAPGRNISEAVHVAPVNVTEKRLAAVWADLFGIEADTISARANFFFMGGHSLLLMRLMTALRSSFEVALPLQALFDAEDLRAMATLIDAEKIHASAAADSSLDQLEEVEW